MRWKILFFIFLVSYFFRLSKLNIFDFKELFLFFTDGIDNIGLFSFAFDKYLFSKKFWFYYFVLIVIFVILRLSVFFTNFKLIYQNTNLIILFTLQLFGMLLSLFVTYSLSQGKTNKDYEK